MSTITRFIPNSSPTRLQVLTKAKEKKDSLLPAQNIFTATTTARLDIIQPDFEAAINDVMAEKGNAVAATNFKNLQGKKLRMFCSHYLQVFNFGVERGKYTVASRAYFGLNTETGHLPSMVTDEEVEQVAKNIATGEVQLISHGLPAMANPSAAEVAAELAGFKTVLLAHSNAAQVLDQAQEAVDALVPEADKVIRKIYDEAEAHFNEEEAASMRADCEFWGVIYISIGNETQVTVFVKNADGTPVAGAGVKLVQAAGKVLISGADGKVVFTTKVNGNATLEVYLNPESPSPDATQEITIVEEVPLTVEVVL